MAFSTSLVNDIPKIIALQTVVACAGLRLDNAWASGYGLKTLSTTRKPPFLTKFGLRLPVQASGFELTTAIVEAARSNHLCIHHPHCILY